MRRFISTTNASPREAAELFVQGFFSILDGLVLFLSFGLLCSSFELEWAFRCIKKKISRTKARKVVCKQ